LHFIPTASCFFTGSPPRPFATIPIQIPPLEKIRIEKGQKARALKRECSERFRDGGATAPSRGRGIFQQENIRDTPRLCEALGGMVRVTTESERIMKSKATTRASARLALDERSESRREGRFPLPREGLR